jgi:hypothetical protein
MERRTFLTVTGTSIAAGLGGCQRTIGDEADRPQYDCTETSRPYPGGNSSHEPQPYPEGPPEPDDIELFVRRYESGFRVNRLIETQGDDLVGFGIDGYETDRFDAPDEAAIIRVKYYYYYEVKENPDEPPVHIDSSTTYASYYIDEDVVLRAAAEGPRDDEAALDPDPMEAGDPLECF